jgi:TetR/AcrR family transcriptional regulator, transcriptional repressor for nem operon
MVRYREGHRERTRAEIIGAASRLMRDRGFDEATVGAVMKQVGLTHGGFYAHFPDKAAMLAAAMEAAFAESPGNFAALARLAQSGGDTGVIAKHYLADQRVANLATGCPAAALMSETPRQEAPIRAAFQAGSEATVRALSAAPGLSEGERGTAWAAYAMLIGGLTLMRAVPDAALAAQIREQIIAALRRLAAPADAAPTPEKDPA